MPFLRLQDYKKRIKLESLSQVLSGDDGLRIEEEESSVEEIRGYLVQRYDMDKVFIEIQPFDEIADFKEGDLIELTAPVYSNVQNYQADELVLYQSNIYKAKQATVGNLPTNNTFWGYVSEDKALFYAKQDTTGNLPDDTAYWEKGDNRNKLMVRALIDVTLYHLHSRINPKNVPDYIKDRYDGNTEKRTAGVIGWLKDAAAGIVTAELPLKDPEQGNRIRYGSNPKFDNANEIW